MICESCKKEIIGKYWVLKQMGRNRESSIFNFCSMGCIREYVKEKDLI